SQPGFPHVRRGADVQHHRQSLGHLLAGARSPGATHSVLPRGRLALSAGRPEGSPSMHLSDDQQPLSTPPEQPDDEEEIPRTAMVAIIVVALLLAARSLTAGGGHNHFH